MAVVQTRLWLQAGAAALLVAALSGCVMVPAPGYGGPMVQSAPPAAYYESPTVAPGVGYFWINGYWGWSGHRHIWVPGRWAPHRPGYHWQPHRWHQDGRGWREAPGHWRAQ